MCPVLCAPAIAPISWDAVNDRGELPLHSVIAAGVVSPAPRRCAERAVVSLDSREQYASFAAWREWRIGNRHLHPIAFDLYSVPEGFARHLVGVLMNDGGHRQHCSLENVGTRAGDDGIVRRD